MDIILLRKLSYKSILGFGQYANMTISQIIALGKHSYLKWIYFNIAGISFTDELLCTELFLTLEYRIKKPGIDPDLWIKYSKMIQHKHGMEGKISKDLNKIRLNARYTGTRKMRSIYSKKSVLQAKNQGH